MKIIGFRSGKTWKKVLASLGYLMILGVIVSAFNGNDDKVIPVTAPVQQEKVEQQKSDENTSVDKTKVDKTKQEEVIPSTPTPNVPEKVTVPISPTPTPVADPIVETPKTPEPTSQTVYGTKTGSKYHLDGCRTLKSKIPMSIDVAKSKGLQPCGVCNPPR